MKSRGGGESPLVWILPKPLRITFGARFFPAVLPSELEFFLLNYFQTAGFFPTGEAKIPGG